MTRIRNSPVDVITDSHDKPISFTFGGCQYQVKAVLECWVETGRWWEREQEKITHRVSTTDGGLYELTWDPSPRQWFLYKTYD